jgi:EAL domain-containing protein (putative c-di-GMP-specific phosphodiesterase class I)
MLALRLARRGQQPLDCFIAAQRTRRLSDLLTEGRLETHFQPVVAVADPSVPYAYECLLRGQARDGSLIGPGALFDAAKQAGRRAALSARPRGAPQDDFGSGYSTAKLIGALRPDFLKLDLELIRGIDGDACKAELASGLLETARNLGIRTIAEGIETEAEWAWVRTPGADYAQGYYFARPDSPPPPVRIAADSTAGRGDAGCTPRPLVAIATCCAAAAPTPARADAASPARSRMRASAAAPRPTRARGS